MQHIVHIFIGEELVSFRDRFSSIFRELSSEITDPFFTPLSLTINEDGELSISPDCHGNTLDGTILNKSEKEVGLTNFFEDIYSRKVTVAAPGNSSLVVIIWTLLYEKEVYKHIITVVRALERCKLGNIKIEVFGFTNFAVSCFVPDVSERLTPNEYETTFTANIKSLKEIQSSLISFKLIGNCNTNNLALNFTTDIMARVGAEYSYLLAKHYLPLTSFVPTPHTPFESFGISKIHFDKKYYQRYMTNQVIIDKIEQEDIKNRNFNINTLALKSNPIIDNSIESLKKFHHNAITDATAKLALAGSNNATDIIGSIDTKLQELISNLDNDIKNLINSNDVTFFEKEALLSLILGEDCQMFETSAVSANELTIDDIIEDSVLFFIDLDKDFSYLQNVRLNDIKEVRTKMRNIAVANRNREERLKALNVNLKEADEIQRRIQGNNYHFEGVDYKLVLELDTDTLDEKYEPHKVSTDSIDLRSIFGKIRNQGSQGSCTAFAVSSVIEAIRRDNKQYSPAYLYWQARNLEKDSDKDSGSSLNTIIKVASEKGVCQENLMPYNNSLINIIPNEEADADALKNRIIEAKSVEPNIYDIKSAVSDGFPVIIAAQIFDSFSNSQKGFVKHPVEEEISNGGRKDGHGYHAMVVCGFSDNEKVFVVRNSWGKDFGDNGYCYIPYSYAEKYFLQACIITKLSKSESVISTHTKINSLNFNVGDSQIEAAILQNLIHEDNLRLETLAEKSALLKTRWTQNLATLGNVNCQSNILDSANQDLQQQISDLNDTASKLRSELPYKLKEYRKENRIWAMWVLLTTVLCWLVFWLTPGWLTMVIALISTIFTTGFIGRLGWLYRIKKHDLKNEIEEYVTIISGLTNKISTNKTKSHIYGTILNKVGTFKIALQNQLQKLRLFNCNLLDTYRQAMKDKNEMRPDVPYPFLTVLDNQTLDNDYNRLKNGLLSSFSLDNIFERFKTDSNISDVISKDQNLLSAIQNSLNDFDMINYITSGNVVNKNLRINNLFPEMDKRSTPFSSLGINHETTIGKYIFINNFSFNEMPRISPYFGLQPTPISTNDPYSILVLNVVKYNL